MDDFNSMATGIGFTISIIFPFLIASRMVTGGEDPKSKQYKKKIIKSTVVLVILGLTIDLIIDSFSGNFSFNAFYVLGAIVGRTCVQYLICEIAFWTFFKRRSKDKSNIGEDAIMEEFNTVAMSTSDTNENQVDNNKSTFVGEDVKLESTAKEIDTAFDGDVANVQNGTNSEPRDGMSNSGEIENIDGEFEIERIISNSDSPLLRRAMLFIEEKKWNQADSHIEQELDRFPENGKAYLLSLLSDSKSTTFDELISKSKNVISTSNFKFAKRFADDDTKEFIQTIENAALSNKNDEKPGESKTTIERYKNIIAVLSLCLVICAFVAGGLAYQLNKLSNVKDERDSYKTILEDMYIDNLVFVFDDDNYYHRYGCPNTPMSPDKSDDYTYYSYSIEEAKEKGYHRCPYCFNLGKSFSLKDYEKFYMIGNY